MIVGLSGVRADVIPWGMVQGPLANLVGLNVVGMRRRGFAKPDLHRVRAGLSGAVLRRRRHSASGSSASRPTSAGDRADRPDRRFHPRRQAAADHGDQARRSRTRTHERRRRRAAAEPLAVHLRRRQPAAGGGRRRAARAGAGSCCLRCAASPIGLRSSAYPHHWIVSRSDRQIPAGCCAREGCRDVVFIGSAGAAVALADPSRSGGRFASCRSVLARLSRRRRSSVVEHGRLLEAQGFRLRRRARGGAADPGAGRSARPRAAVRSATAPTSRCGLDYLRATGPFDVGQAVVVADAPCARGRSRRGHRRHAGAGGGDCARRPHPRAGGTGVLVKAPKPGQDRRFDLPTIGPQNRRGRRARRARRPRRRRRRNHRRRAGRRWCSGPTAPASSWSVCRPARMHERRGATQRDGRPARLSGRDRGVRRPARRRADRGAAPSAPAARVRFSGVGGAHMAARGRAQPVPDRRSRDHGLCRHPGAPAARSCAASAKRPTR